MMSDDPYIMRQDPLTQLPLCPSAARKPRLISPILIHHLSAVVCFGHTESGVKEESVECFGRDQ